MNIIELLKITARVDELVPQDDRIHVANGTLMLGVLVSMVTAVLVTRFLMNRFVAAGCTDMKFFVKLNSDKEVAE